MKSSTATMDLLAGAFSALGTGVRLRILQLLLQADTSGMSVGAIKTKVRIPGSTLSFHLDRLKRHELVTVEREGAVLRYAVNPKVLSRMAGFFQSECRTSNTRKNVRVPARAARTAHLHS